jgi:carbamoyltransferase
VKILGIHDGHNSSACLVEDGIIKFAIQEERLVNQKNKSGFPKKSIEKILKTLNLTIDDIDKIAIASKHSSVVFADEDYFKKEQKWTIKRHAEIAFTKTPLYSIYKSKRKKERLQNLINFGFNEKKIVFVDHHLSHAATAYFGSDFPRDEKVLVLTNDGAGDGLCATVSIGWNNSLKTIAKVDKDNSLAGIYCLITKMMGFKPLEHEYKLMGMAPYASEYGLEKGYSIFKDLISLSQENPLEFKRNVPEPISLIMPRLLKRSKFIRFDWICAGLQHFTEDILVQWVKNCLKETGLNKVALAGGIFMNVKANQKIMEIPELQDLFIFPSCGDETTSIGAAYHVYNLNRNNESPEIKPISNFNLGDVFTNEETLEQIKLFENELSFEYHYIEDIEKEIASLLAKKEVVAICQGNMEFGARALGNRSILADASNLDCVREINMMIKNRDFWMPFAPVMLKERANDYIKNPKNISAPYMILTFDTTNKYNDLISAVQQADLTARPQIIERENNPYYHDILKEFENITGRGVMLNTSFNLHGLPIVHGPKEALEVFRDSGLKNLAIGNYLIKKR